MLLRIDCPSCPSEYAWQTTWETDQNDGRLVVRINLRCVDCDHIGLASSVNAVEAAVTALRCYRIQTTAKEESA